MSWQPIETAPKDGTEVLLFIPVNWGETFQEVPRIGNGNHVEAAWYNPTRRLWLNRLDQWIKEQTPTHWMPLPEPPKEVLK
jgi:hypothetical protein